MQFTESFIDTVNAAWANKNGHTVNVSKYACTDTHRPFHLCVALTMRFERCLSHSLNSFIFNKFFFCVNWLSDLFYTVHIITWFCKFEQKKNNNRQWNSGPKWLWHHFFRFYFFKLPKIDILNEMKHTHDEIIQSVFFFSFHTRTDTIVPINKSKFLRKLLDNFMILIAMVQF